MAAIITDPMYYSSLIRQKIGDEKHKKTDPFYILVRFFMFIFRSKSRVLIRAYSSIICSDSDA